MMVGRSYTRAEYDEAMKARLDVLVFLKRKAMVAALGQSLDVNKENPLNTSSARRIQGRRRSPANLDNLYDPEAS